MKMEKKENEWKTGELYNQKNFNNFLIIDILFNMVHIFEIKHNLTTKNWIFQIDQKLIWVENL